MKLNYLLIPVFAVSMLTSCIQDEAPNAEADIEYCIIKDKSILALPADTLKKIPSNTTDITIYIKDANANLKDLALSFKLSPGASISPENGTELDFSHAREHEYTVTSEDGRWKRVYKVQFIVPKIPDSFHFEHFELNAENRKYYEWYEVDEVETDDKKENLKYYCWATGNPGFKLAKALAKPDEYPTVPYDFGVGGNAVKLETRSTGSFGAMMNMRLAAGNLFLGTFDAEYALKNAMQATCFGLPFTEEPLELNGYYKFKAGEKFQDIKGNIVPDVKDYCDIYGVLYENTQIVDGVEESVMLHGDDVLTHPSIVALARINRADIVESEDWTEFKLTFDYKKALDKERSRDYGYNLSIVFSSSVDGATFRGAVGSVLYVDKVSLICK